MTADNPGWKGESHRHREAAMKGRRVQFRGPGGRMISVAQAHHGGHLTIAQGASRERNGRRQVLMDEAPHVVGPTHLENSTGGLYTTEYHVKPIVVGGQVYEVPVGEGGKVPEEALISRFLNVEEGDRGGGLRNAALDASIDAEVIVKPDPSPEEAAAWWAHPNESDVKNLDTAGAEIFNIEGTKGKTAKEVGKTIAILGGTKGQRQVVREALSTNFTVAEQKKMRGTTIYITDLKAAAGEYHGKLHDGSYLVRLDRHHGATPETVTHELIHHLRVIDEDRQKDVIVRATPTYQGGNRALEEAATTAETQARYRPFKTTDNASYYGLLRGNGRYLRAQDRAKLTEKEVNVNSEGNATDDANPDLAKSGKKGKKVLKQMDAHFKKCNIAALSLKGSCEAKDQLRILENEGKKEVTHNGQA